MTISQLFRALILSFTLLGCAITPVKQHFLVYQLGADENRSATKCHSESFIPLQRLIRADHGLSSEHITLLSWNIYKEKKDGWLEDLIRYGNKRDLILLQEARLIPAFESYAASSGLNWSFNSAFHYGGYESGVFLGSLSHPNHSCGLRQSEPIIRIPKTAVVTSYAIKGSKELLLVANVHGINFTFGTTAYRNQFNELQNILKAHSGPLIVAGDFNDWRDDRNLIIAKFAEKLGLTILSFEANDNRSRFYGATVDHIFYRGLEPVQFDVHEVLSSDHNPITVTFRVLGSYR